jgi:hypothetical protein
MSNAVSAWSLAFTISIVVLTLILSDGSSTTTFQIEAAQKQGNATSVLTNNNTIAKTNDLIDKGID